MANVSKILYNGTTYGIEGVTDQTLSISGLAADAAAVGAALARGSGLTEEVKQALLACFAQVAWIGDDGQDYYDDLYDALYPGYSITNNLTDVTNSNSATSVAGGSSYTATLTATTGYIDQIVVTMGGVDITNQVWTPS